MRLGCDTGRHTTKQSKGTKTKQSKEGTTAKALQPRHYNGAIMKDTDYIKVTLDKDQKIATTWATTDDLLEAEGVTHSLQSILTQLLEDSQSPKTLILAECETIAPSFIATLKATKGADDRQKDIISSLCAELEGLEDILKHTRYKQHSYFWTSNFGVEK